uniref:Uncharacterized protein n=1 Tax=Nelumbo nucifera TaxID=4432 RepID=A0A822YMH4_NELNU|nr:TPA_asm: hypothetical protein HUJ06_011360 [Nelumbo nucifera]
MVTLHYKSSNFVFSGRILSVTDMSASVFVKDLPVVDFVHQTLNKNPSTRPLSDADRLKIKKALIGLKIEVTHRGNIRRRYRISGITSESTTELSFPFGDTGTPKYVVQYFKETYNVILEHTSLPCLQVGSNEKPIYLPMEFCKIVRGQNYKKKLNDNQISNMVGFNCKSPIDREEDILKTGHLYRQDIYAMEFGMKISDNLASVQAHVLPAPRLKYHDSGSEKTCKPQVGQWNMMNKKMVDGGTVNTWTCINFADNVSDPIACEFCNALGRMCHVSGMKFNIEPILPPRKVPQEVDTALENLYQDAMSVLKPCGKELDLLIAILPDNNGALYGEFKRKCDTKLGMISQCCLAKNVSKPHKQYLANVALKINAKVGGRNTVLEDIVNRCMPMVSDKPTIIFGADVTHPSPGDLRSPSIAAVVASQDWPEVTKYACLFSAQASRVEMIQDLYTECKDPLHGKKICGGMIREHLLSYIANNKRKPERIIFYRDGVSEGQFHHVLQHELRAIKQAWISLAPESSAPPITFVVVQKRHHTRLFPYNHNDFRSVDQKSGNVIPGTVVDSDICHHSQFDFFLLSHRGIKGTSRPTHYHVLWDENKFKADQLQTLTNNLCYIYSRCTRSVSYVAPAYYAHLAAFRARFYLGHDSSSDASSADYTQAADIPVRQLPTLAQNLKKTMFYI